MNYQYYFLDNNNNIIKPFSFSELKKRNPNISFESKTNVEDLVGNYNIVSVEVPNQIEYDSSKEKLSLSEPFVENGIWKRTWNKILLSESEILSISTQKESEVREERNLLLSQSDWTQCRDVNLSNDIEWVEYRQKLRDITNQPEFPHTVTWPKKP